MPRRILDRTQAAIRDATYDMTIHAVEEMAEDGLDITDFDRRFGPCNKDLKLLVIFK